ncbi:hypothetical protein CEP53_010145 [Fusarium sp. AF-6]|nr:hypothetical protein CEP53_010145 [Fusarium sp. AF-6]
MAAPSAPGPGSGPFAAQYHRVALGIGLEGYVAPDLDEAYRLHAAQSGAAVTAPAPHHHAPGQFGILAPTAVPVPVPVVETQQIQGVFGAQMPPQQVERSNGQLSSKIVVDPPDLEAWRDKLFNVDEMIVLTHEQFETYFPHVDNVYSHRSTQRYKRKPFVSHYWDCRMKGRPPGTPKSDDPNKKKRKRNARERDLCDVKIKITEYLPGAQLQLEPSDQGQAGPAILGGFAGVAGQQRFWTIQRVNGNGGNGKGDGVAGPHKHTLEKSDEIKKNSVQRYLAKQERETKKAQKPPSRKTTGAALATARKHAKDNTLKLYGACFCPFSQRVWIALEAKGMAYQYCETDPFRRPAPTHLLEANPHGYVPAIKQGEWTCAESGVILEYLEDLGQGMPLLPTDPQSKATCRLWIGHINNRIVPPLFTLLQTQEIALQHDASERLQTSIDSLVQAADEQGPFFLGPNLSLVDIHLAPFALRLPRILTSLRGWSPPPPGSRWARWLDAIESDESIRATTSDHELYADTVDLLVRRNGLGG